MMPFNSVKQTVLAALIIISSASFTAFQACNAIPKPKFLPAAELVCDGLEDFEHLHNGILSISMLMERGDYNDALQVAFSLLELFDETKDVKGLNELRALIFLLESVIKDQHEPH
jgi:hypothetical protein